MRRLLFFYWTAFAVSLSAAPVIDPVPDASIPAGKSLIIPVTATSPNGRPLTFTATSSTNPIGVEVHTNNPFWKMSVVQASPSNAPGAFLTPFRDGLVSVTNVGDMTFMLFRDIAPHTVDVIQGLTASGFYTGNTIFHRVMSGFMIQGGDPLTNGMGGPVFRYEDEFHPQALFSGHGQLALANSGKDRDGSQFFVTLGSQRLLDFGYTLFGQLVRGFNVLTHVGATPTNTASRPLADVIITQASFVPDTTDTVLTLTGTNLAGVSGTIQVIADDGAGGRATNTFTATTVSDSANNAPPILYPMTVTHCVVPMNGRITNTVATLDLEGNTPSCRLFFLDEASYLAASNSTFNSVNGQLVIIPNAGYNGPVRLYVKVAPNSLFSTYDYQAYTFAVGDTPIIAAGTHFAVKPLEPWVDQLLAMFTNGVPNSPTGSFTAFINWGDNSTNNALIVSHLDGQKEVRGSHTYTNAGNYPVYITIKSALGSEAKVITAASVLPSLTLARSGTDKVIRWPAWATDYQLQSHTNLNTTNWTAVTNIPSLEGYESVVTNSTDATGVFFRLNK